MSSDWTSWFGALPPFPGLLAAGLRSPDQTTLSKTWEEGFPDSALANAWRCADDTFRVMRSHRFPTRQLRWTYDAAILTAIRRDDGCLLLILTRVEMPDADDLGISSWIEAFLAGSGE